MEVRTTTRKTMPTMKRAKRTMGRDLTGRRRKWRRMRRRATKTMREHGLEKLRIYCSRFSSILGNVLAPAAR